MAKHTANQKADENISSVIGDKSIRLKERITKLSGLLLSGSITIDEILNIASKESDTNQATLMEVLEHASKINPRVITKKGFQFAISSLDAEAPRLKWESARMLSNAAHLFPKLHEKAIPSLLNNSEHAGTVVRWSAATALNAFMKCNSQLHEELVPAVEAILTWEKDNAIRKIYTQALKKMAK